MTLQKRRKQTCQSLYKQLECSWSLVSTFHNHITYIFRYFVNNIFINGDLGYLIFSESIY